jgi:hypothetical protein
MSDENTTQDQLTIVNGIPLPSRRTRKRFVIATMTFCAIVITYVVGWGEPQNSLHTSALAWSFGTAVATMFGYVFGAVIDNMNVTNAIKSNSK